jgi:hypothetical protein
MQSHCEAVRIFGGEKLNLLFQPPKQIGISRHAICPLHFIPHAGSPMMATCWTGSPFFERQCENWKILPAPFQDQGADFSCIVARLQRPAVATAPHGGREERSGFGERGVIERWH